jgi:hypothetical protein
MTLRYTEEERAAFLRTRPELQYTSIERIEWELDIGDARISLELAERYFFWLMVLFDPEAPDLLKDVAAQMIYLTGFMDAKQGKSL